MVEEPQDMRQKKKACIVDNTYKGKNNNTMQAFGGPTEN